ncbi:hypothetical protein QAD02_001169 [Eretmocerus hayati]|uniref:Uncharacterized protein n=1 Tax=Eretmocerus hayati TaxID=131215 RepID=A0ACC2NFE5_9HYME|nr:hypothetical protein QAD02_001169 [Eretmocerus hayati]
MRGQAALLLLALLALAQSSVLLAHITPDYPSTTTSLPTTTTTEVPRTPSTTTVTSRSVNKRTTTEVPRSTTTFTPRLVNKRLDEVQVPVLPKSLRRGASSISSDDSEISSILSIDAKKILEQNIRSDDDDTNNEKIQEEVAKLIKKASKPPSRRASAPLRVRLSNSSSVAAAHGSYNSSGCPDYCRCIGQYAATTTARCTKLLEDQGFGSGIAHLKIENAGDIRLGPHALRKLGLRQLESISIVNTKIVELDRSAFDGLRELFVVNLTHNGLTAIHPDTFQNNSQLSLLTIADNPIKISPSRREYLLDAPSVTELDFSSNRVTRLPKRAFAKMPNLAYISLKNNGQKNIERDLFAPLDSLVELDLSHNNLADLPADLFKGKGLQTLKISGNNLTSLKSIRAAKLTTLDVSMNRLKLIGKDDLDGVPYLDQLYLSANSLKRIHSHAFSDLDQLTYLDLSNNKLGSLTEHHFRANSRLQVLLLSDNPDLETLPVFRTNAQEFERFSIYRFECENCGLTFIESGTFDAMPAMTRLNLARNKLTGMPKDLMRSLSSLRELDLSMNRLDRLEDDMFEGATSLTKLSLAMNSFVSGLRVTPFLKTPNLLRLDVSFCGMQRIWSEARLPIKSLRFLSLHKNRLTRVTVEELRAMPNLSALDLTGNPLRCDEDLSKAVQWLTDNNVTPSESTRAMGSMRHDYDDEVSANESLGASSSSSSSSSALSSSSSSSSSSVSDTLNQWTNLAKKLCDSWEGGLMLQPRPVPKKTAKKPVSPVASLPRESTDEETQFEGLPGPYIKFDFGDEDSLNSAKLDFGQGHGATGDEIESAWNSQDAEYDEIANMATVRYREWYSEALWPLVTVILITVAILLMLAHLAVCMARRRGRGPVIRTPVILRPGFIDSKNCGLVYKPLHEEMPTPHMPKRGSFYSSSTFHYDKIVPESV